LIRNQLDGVNFLKGDCIVNLGCSLSSGENELSVKFLDS